MTNFVLENTIGELKVLQHYLRTAWKIGNVGIDCTNEDMRMLNNRRASSFYSVRQDSSIEWSRIERHGGN